jgi:iron complex outermembrane receptor protein
MRVHGVRNAVVAALLAAACPSTGSAQEVAASAGLDEVVVTARKREERLQDVPVAVSAIDGDSLQQAGTTDFRELANLVPSLQYDGTGGKQLVTPVIRGLSQVSRLDDENNTAVFMDGVFVSGREGLDFDLLDIERVEVARGPQSALFGRNAYAGAINYITKRPSDTLTAGITATVGDHRRRAVQGFLSGPLAPGLLAGRISAGYDAWDGEYRNERSGRGVGGDLSRVGSIALQLTPTEAMSFTLRGFATNDEIPVSPQGLVAANCERVGAFFTMYCGEAPDYEGGYNWDPRAKGLQREIRRASLTAEWDLGPVVVTSVSGYNEFESDNLLDFGFDGRPFALVRPATPTVLAGTQNLPLLLSAGNVDKNEFQQEVRLESNGGGRLTWVAGLFYYHTETRDTQPVGFDTSGIPSGLVAQASLGPLGFLFRPVSPDVSSSRDLPFVLNDATSHTNSTAAFGGLTWNATDRVSASLEARYTEERKHQARNIGAPAYVAEKFVYTTPRVSVDFRPAEGRMIYLSAARGAKAGGFNASAPTPADRPYGPETNWTYELGAKTDWLDRRLRLNVTLFNTEMQDIQISSRVEINGVTNFLTRNAGTGRSRGVEIELTTRPVDGLTAFIGYTLADAKFKDAVDQALRVYPSFAANPDVSGEPLPRSAKHAASVSLQYERPLFGTWTGIARLDGRYTSRKYDFTTSRFAYAPATTFVNLRLGVASESFDVAVWAKNLFDNTDPYIISSLSLFNASALQPGPATGMFSKPNEGRTVGVTATYRY